MNDYTYTLLSSVIYITPTLRLSSHINLTLHFIKVKTLSFKILRYLNKNVIFYNYYQIRPSLFLEQSRILP